MKIHNLQQLLKVIRELLIQARTLNRDLLYDSYKVIIWIIYRSFFNETPELEIALARLGNVYKYSYFDLQPTSFDDIFKSYVELLKEIYHILFYAIKDDHIRIHYVDADLPYVEIYEEEENGCA